jgi:ribonuclease VapC
MVLDTSAIVALLFKEAGFERLLEKVERAEVIAVGAPTLLECATVLTSRLSQDARLILTGTLKKMNAEIIPFTEEHAEVALDAFVRFGRGRHPAGLNFGDCMSYATAVVAGLPLLFTGSDFARTDVQEA